MKYKEMTIFPFVPLAQSPNHAISNDFVLVGKGYKKQEKYVTKPSSRRFEWEFAPKSLGEVRAMRDFFRLQRGRLGSFWLASFKQDIESTVLTAPNGSSILVRNARRSFGLFGHRRHIFIPSLNFAAKITSVTIPDGTLEGDELLGIEPSIPSLLPAGSEIQLLFLVRFASDEFSYTQKGKNLFSVQLLFQEIQGETP